MGARSWWRAITSTTPTSTPPAPAEAGGRLGVAIEGEAGHLPDWRARAAALGLDSVWPVAIPMDRRHRSKDDCTALHGRLGG